MLKDKNCPPLVTYCKHNFLIFLPSFYLFISSTGNIIPSSPFASLAACQQEPIFIPPSGNHAIIRFTNVGNKNTIIAAAICDIIFLIKCCWSGSVITLISVITKLIINIIGTAIQIILKANCVNDKILARNNIKS